MSGSMSIEDRIKEMMPQLTEQVATEVRRRALEQLEHYTASVIVDEVKKYVADALLPQIQKELKGREVELRAAFLAAIQLTFETAAAKVTESATKKLASYEGDKLVQDVVKAIFGFRY